MFTSLTHCCALGDSAVKVIVIVVVVVVSVIVDTNLLYCPLILLSTVLYSKTKNTTDAEHLLKVI